MVLLIALLVVLGISLLSLIGGVLLLYKEKLAKFLSKYLVSFAIGALLAVAFLDLLPEAIEQHTAGNVLIYSLAGILVFYMGEKTLLWYHHHSLEHIEEHKKHHPEEKAHPVGYLITIGDAMHNFLDGVIIAASFLVDIRLGFVTSLAVLFHELPQEIGDFAVMLHAGFGRTKVFLYNLFAQLTAVLGVLIGFFYLPLFENFEAILLAFAAGAFIYVASTDLLPETHREKTLSKSALQVGLLVLGILAMWYIGILFHE
ncbi:MAG: ZIP family metal transporter [Candidatus Aenigmarchaeota archaeon]|nr:ZIP family metal transporter [Candidatus Aenigmarchaeota archaeon]